MTFYRGRDCRAERPFEDDDDDDDDERPIGDPDQDDDGDHDDDDEDDDEDEEPLRVRGFRVPTKPARASLTFLEDGPPARSRGA
jgi:hypothetical protein